MAFTSASEGDVNRSAPLIRLLSAGILLLAWTSASADPVETKIGYLRRAEPKTSLSLIQLPPENNGIAGAQLAIYDNNTTGKFLNQQFSLEEIRIDENKDAAAANRSAHNGEISRPRNGTPDRRQITPDRASAGS